MTPFQENYPACTMPLASTTPAVVTAGILCNPQYVVDYIRHVGLIRELLNHASLSENPAVLGKVLYQAIEEFSRSTDRVSQVVHSLGNLFPHGTR